MEIMNSYAPPSTCIIALSATTHNPLTCDMIGNNHFFTNIKSFISKIARGSCYPSLKRFPDDKALMITRWIKANWECYYFPKC